MVQSTKKAAFTEEDISALKTMVDQLAIAIQNAQLYKQAQSEIEERKRIEKELQKTENYLSNIVDSMPSALIGIDEDGKVTQWNYEAERVSGLPPAQALGSPLGKVFPRLSTELERVHTALKSREVQIDPKRAYQENGETHYEDVTIYPLIANGIEGAVIRVDDVTEKVQIEELMLQSEKMLSVGGLAAGMAHEINNPLAGIMQTASVMSNRLTNIDMLANQRAAEEVGVSMTTIHAFMEARDIPRMLKAINESGQRVAEIVDNMLSFARRSDAAITTINLIELLEKTLELATTDYDLKREYDFKTIKIIKEYEGDLPFVPCEGSKIQQVFLNILRNGAQAMHSIPLKKEDACFILRMAHEKDTNMVRIEIEDNGSGMDEGIQKRIFEPFFTTKAVGEGTGLGLSVSFFIITENHCGTLEVESEPEEGAKFIIRLPISGVGV
ncbi:MAG: PAS domain S-box protein [Anaerolineae bacterium]|nr:PAS domain S-box protein [Anaerolineae bacterium]MBT7783089.1 PAS domain S-box protein [Anaerolineae bacterium]